MNNDWSSWLSWPKSRRGMVPSSVGALVALGVIAPAMAAQITFHPRNPGAAAAAGWGVGWGAGFAPGYTGSTPAESYARGQAEVIRAQADAYQAAARGAIDYEQARTTYINNQLHWQQVRQQRQQMGQAQRDEQAAQDRATRQRRQAMASTSQPQLLSSSQYDRSTGQIAWPEVLQGGDFAQNRARLESLLKTRALTGDSVSLSQQIVDETNATLTLLRTRVRDTPPALYMESRRFLDQLIDEMRHGNAG